MAKIPQSKKNFSNLKKKIATHTVDKELSYMYS